nr:TrbI/VirB10 family protein [Argonema antarcticum]
MQVQIGTSAKAKVLVPMIWSEENKSNQGRFAVQLEEDVLSTDNRVALPKGTILITEVDSVTPDNNLVNQSAVAIVYPDSAGEVRQQSIKKESILIRGEDGKPLIAKGLRDKGGEIARQDILIGLLGAAGRAGEVINQNQSQSSTIISSGGFSSQTITTSARRPDVLAAAVEGFFKPMSQRLSQRADSTTQEILNRPNVAIIPQNTEVSVFFNTFFVVNR